MKAKKLLAISIATLMFVVFFEVGYIAFRPPEPSVQYEYRYVTKAVYVTNRVPESMLVNGIGVHDDNKTGEIVEINVSIEPGEGRVFFDTTFHSYGADLQDSMSAIIKCAEKATGETLNSLDVKVNLRSEAHTVEGTSGGAALGAGLIALLENKTIRSDVAITGTLDEHCRIGSIAELGVKIKVAEQNGLSKIIVPKSQCIEANKTTSIKVACAENIMQAIKEMTE
ncbi:MAG: S16 family serine protease [archaeon]